MPVRSLPWASLRNLLGRVRRRSARHRRCARQPGPRADHRQRRRSARALPAVRCRSIPQGFFSNLLTRWSAAQQRHRQCARQQDSGRPSATSPARAPSCRSMPVRNFPPNFASWQSARPSRAARQRHRPVWQPGPQADHRQRRRPARTLPAVRCQSQLPSAICLKPLRQSAQPGRIGGAIGVRSATRLRRTIGNVAAAQITSCRSMPA